MHVNLKKPRESSLRRPLTCAAAVALAGGVTLAVALPAAAAVPTPGQIVPVSVVDPAASAFAKSGREPSVSADGRFVAFSSEATDLPDANGVSQVYLRDMTTGTLTTISMRFNGTAAGAFASTAPVVSADGR